jgi:hypothetical protein
VPTIALHSAVLHRGLRGRFAAAVGQLDADRRPLSLHEGDQRLEAFDLRIAPDPEVVLVDQPDLFDAGRLDKNQTETAQRVTAEMHDMEGAAGMAGVAAIMDHRRHHETIFQRQAPDRKRPKQHRR